MTRRGGAAAAAKVLGKSTSQLNAIRDRTILEYDPITRTAIPLPAREEMEMTYLREVGPLPGGVHRYDPVRTHYIASRYLVCPTLYAYKLPGASWEYDLTALESLLRNGPPGC